KLEGKPEDLIIESWLTESINGMIQMLLPAFKKIIEPHILEFLIGSEKPEDRYRGLVEYNWVEPFFQVSPEVIDKLTKWYRELYPFLYEDLSNIFENVPQEIESERLQIEYEKISRKIQSACKHRTPAGKSLLERINDVDIYGERVEQRYVERCSHCHYTVPKRIYENKTGH
ncbi:MAG: hypothetical protein ABJB85_12270, partial [Nitrososphaerota archaeon]